MNSVDKSARDFALNTEILQARNLEVSDFPHENLCCGMEISLIITPSNLEQVFHPVLEVGWCVASLPWQEGAGMFMGWGLLLLLGWF